MDEESREEVWPVGDTPPCVKVVLLEVLPDDRGLVSVTNVRFLVSCVMTSNEFPVNCAWPCVFPSTFRKASSVL
jgi:hypothetical protein